MKRFTARNLLLQPEHLALVRKNAQAEVEWDGGCALPFPTPPELVVAMIDEIARLRAQAELNREAG